MSLLFGCLLQFKLIMTMAEEYIHKFYVMEFKSLSYHNRHILCVFFLHSRSRVLKKYQMMRQSAFL